MCGIAGIYSHEQVSGELYDCLIHLQHRGQDACGIVTLDTRFHALHGRGLVREALQVEDVLALKGATGIAHNRYPTAGGYELSDIQPLWVSSPYALTLAHNGNLVNHEQLLDELAARKLHPNSSLDSEALLMLLAEGLAEQADVNDEEAFFEMLCQAVATIFQKAKGSYSVVAAIVQHGLLAFRDPHGIRPLVMAERRLNSGKKDYMFASESTPFYSLGFEATGDVLPGELVYVSQSGRLFRRVLEKKAFRPCVFEYVYFSRPDTTTDNVSVYRSRLRMGQNLALLWKKKHPDIIPDVVIPAPFTANTAALSFANELDIRYSEGLYKNPFVGRTFIMPNQQMRSQQVRYKLTPQKTEINKKKVLIVDDSIVRGTTSREIVRMVREYGAKAVYFAVTAPPLKHPCLYGIDIPSRKKLIAANKTEVEIAQYLGVDELLYQTQEDLLEAVTRRGEKIQKLCMACMDGQYISGDINEETFLHIEKQRSSALNSGESA